MLCGSAFKNKGVQPLLDAVVDYLPSPLERAAIKGIDFKTERGDRAPAVDDEPFSLLAFKIMDDPFVGTITFCRVYSGKVETGTTVLNSTKRQEGARRPHAADACEQPRGHQGSLSPATSSRWPASRIPAPATRCATCGSPSSSRSMEFPEPVIEIAIEPKSKADQEKLGVALSKLAAEDPSFRVSTDQESGQTILKGMGELHLDIKVDILQPHLQGRGECRRAAGRLP